MNNKCSGINMTKDMNNLYTENYKVFLTEIKDVKMWKNWPLLFNIVEM